MKKNMNRVCFVLSKHRKKILIMRNTLLFLFVTVFQALAGSSFSQTTKLNLEMKNATVREVLSKIEENSNFYFLYNEELVDVNRKVSLSIKNESIENVLSRLFDQADVKATINDRHIVLTPVSGNSAQQRKNISGTVKDAIGQPLPGVTVIIEGTTIGAITGVDGSYVLSNVPDNGTLTFSFIGMKTLKIPVSSRTQINVTMEEGTIGIEEVVAVGYGTQRKATLTGAIASVKSDEIMATKNQNVQNMLTGKISGVRVVQKTSEPGNFSNQFDIRGFGTPLIVIDGVPRGDMQKLDPNEIESVTVLKDASAAIYGLRAANGVVLITTKKGEKGAPKMQYSMFYGLQFPAEILKPIGAIDRMLLFNEKTMRSTTNPQLTYTDEDFEAYHNGTLSSTDWYDAVLRSSAPQQQHNFSVSGGSDAIDYFVNLGYISQEGFWKSKDLNYDRINVRSNIEARISDRLRFSLKVTGILDTQNRPIADTWTIFKTLWRSVPTEQVYANNNPDYLAKSSSDIQNVVAMTNSDISGFYKEKHKIIQSSVGLEYDIPYIKGLTASGLFSYDTNISDNTSYTKEYNEYTYDSATGTYTGVAKNSPTSLRRYYGNSESILYQIQLDYIRTFAQNHNLNASLIFEGAHTKGDNINAFREFSISLPYLFAGDSENQVGTSDAGGIRDYSSNGFVGKLNYDYAGKYLFAFNFRQDGSSKFPKGKQWGFFPGGSLGWRISEESFIKNNLYFIDNLKVRASYGKMGDDSAADYQFISGYNYPNTSGGKQSNFPTGYVFNKVYTNALGFRTAANPNITWYTVKTINLGLDTDLWKGKLGFTFEIFKRDRDGLLEDRLVSLPGTFGSTMPEENLESDRTKGIELEVRHQNRIGKVNYNVAGNVSVTRTMNLYQERSPSGNSWDNWRNNNSYRYNDIWFGWESDGQYSSYEQIATSDIYTNNNTLPGDYIYEDWNNDGVIDDYDYHPIATTTNPTSDTQHKRNYPLMNFGLSLTLQYKDFDLNMLFQGAAMSYVSYGDQLSEPLAWNGNALDQFLDRWHPIDPTLDPYDQSNEWISGYYAYGATVANVNSEFSIQNGAYMRLKNIELGYTLPKTWLNKTGFDGMRIFINGYNLMTITGVRGVDPEHPSDLYGYMYPLNKTINIGANITF